MPLKIVQMNIIVFDLHHLLSGNIEHYCHWKKKLIITQTKTTNTKTSQLNSKLKLITFYIYKKNKKHTYIYK